MIWSPSWPGLNTLPLLTLQFFISDYFPANLFRHQCDDALCDSGLPAIGRRRSPMSRRFRRWDRRLCYQYDMDRSRAGALRLQTPRQRGLIFKVKGDNVRLLQIALFSDLFQERLHTPARLNTGHTTRDWLVFGKPMTFGGELYAAVAAVNLAGQVRRAEISISRI